MKNYQEENFHARQWRQRVTYTTVWMQEGRATQGAVAEGVYVMNNREEILTAIKEIMVEMFEIDEQAITLEARLYEDLDFDSIDAVDMIVKLKEMTGKQSKSEDLRLPVPSMMLSRRFIKR